MGKNGKSPRRTQPRGGGPRLLLHLGPGLREAVDPDDIYLVEASADDTRVRTRSARAIRDARPIGDLARLLAPHGFVRIHRNHLVNPAYVRLVRRRDSGGDWEVRLAPPVNAVLPVSRSALRDLWRAFGEGGSR
jgi:DNA-binding LytR/AlgR family response regulator